MLYIHILWFSLLLLLPAGKERWVISESSNLTVKGSTNINKFSCEIPAYDQTDTLSLNRNGKGVTLSGSIGLSIQTFDCHNKMMTRDLRKTLKEKEYPKLHIRFISLSTLPELSTKTQSITGLVNIELAGVTKQLDINYQISADETKVIHLLGTKDIKFSEFDLVPPRKLGGMIKTNDQLTVIFHLNMKTI